MTWIALDSEQELVMMRRIIIEGIQEGAIFEIPKIPYNYANQ